MNNLSEGRDPAKRKVKPVEAPQSLLDFDLAEGESSDDSDFRIEDHPEESDDYSINTDDEKKQDQSESSDDSDSEEDNFKSTASKINSETTVADLLAKASKEFKFPGDITNVLICAGCLGSRSDDFNEIVECDGCGVTVHEGCYGVSDVTSESSTVSSASTEPWFCEACKAGVTDPSCELCPNQGGIFKETEVGAWVHLVCALYVPGVAFSEVERLSGVTLFEMAYSRWGARACHLCHDATMARTGVAVGCDAGLCKTFFHVTCGQREGLLAEAHTEEAEQADPFYAHCRQHSDKTAIKKRRNNWLALQLRTLKRKEDLEQKLSAEEKQRIQRKLVKYRRKYLQHKETRNPPWVPTQKMARMLYSSAWAMRQFQQKAECMGLDTRALEFRDSQMAALKEVSRRWHVPPAFSVEFVGYYLERNSRVTSLRLSLRRLTEEHDKLLAGDEPLRSEYEEAAKANTEALASLAAAQASLSRLHGCVAALLPGAPPPALLARPLLPPEPPRSTPKLTPQQLHKRSMPVPTAAALKMGVGFPLSDNPDARQGKVLSTQATTGALAARDCAVCGRSSERHLMAACDTCRNHYHLHCLSPPLQRPPKKSKLYGWQCSECDKTSDSEPEVMEKKVPRRSRIRYSKDGAIIQDPPSPTFDSPPKHKPEKEKKEKQIKVIPKGPENLPPIKVVIKPFEFTCDDEEVKKKEKKIKKLKQKEHSSPSVDGESPSKKLKLSFTSPALTNTPLMSITPIVAESPHDSHNENSNASTNAAASKKEDTSFLSQNSSFSSLLQKDESIGTSFETTIANLSSDIATYKANRKRRKEKHRSRYSPDLLRSPSKHKHKRKKKTQDMENPNQHPHPHPRITIKIKPIPKPDGTFDTQATQMFYVPADSNDAPPPVKKTNKISIPVAEAPVAMPPQTAVDPPKIPKETVPVLPLPKPKADRERLSRGRGAAGAGRKPAGDLPPLTGCDVCRDAGDATNLVRCDECFKRYHFTCLEPPLNKNPKKRGYSWHCADCDPTDIEDNI